MADKHFDSSKVECSMPDRTRKPSSWRSPRRFSSFRSPMRSKTRKPSLRKVSSTKSLEMVELVGRGSFGEVWHVQHKKQRTDAALKIIDLKTHGEQLQHQVKIEKEMMELVGDHTHVVKLFATWKEKDSVYLLMEYVPGGDLLDALMACRKFTPTRTSRYVLQLGKALDFIHKQGVIYRDLKLENVLLNAVNDSVLITDFGFAKKLATNERTQSICGTIQYMAPEMLREHDYSHSIDWWCLGVATYAMLTGRYPFSKGISELAFDRSRRDRSIMLQRIEEGFIIIPHFISLPAEVALRKLLQADPSDRLQTFEELRTLRWFEEIESSPKRKSSLQTRVSEPALDSAALLRNPVSISQHASPKQVKKVFDLSPSSSHLSAAPSGKSWVSVPSSLDVHSSSAEDEEDFFALLQQHQNKMSKIHKMHYKAASTNQLEIKNPSHWPPLSSSNINQDTDPDATFFVAEASIDAIV